MSDKVVYLAYDNPAVKADADVFLLSCARCRNKTYKLQVAPNCAAEVYCAACGSRMGRMGWYEDEEPA